MGKAPHEIVGHGLREAVSLAFRGVETLKNKYFWSNREVEQARGYLIYYRHELVQEASKKGLYRKIFGRSGEFFELEPFKRGYNAKVFTFKTIVGNEVKKWVVKIGHRNSPVEDFGDPSDPNYFKQYRIYLNILTACVAKYKDLSHLLPEPQDVLWAVLTQEGEDTGTTIAIQPFVHVVRPRQLRKIITRTLRQQLLEELHAFEALSAFLIKEYQVRPELIGEGNLEIVKKGNEYHLMLLDMGWVNLNAPLPITQAVAHFSSEYVVGRLKEFLNIYQK